MARASTRLSTAAVGRMEELPWFAALPPQQRAEVGLVVQTGLAHFASWMRDDGGAHPVRDLFAVAPPELTGRISLKQTVALVRLTVDVLEDAVPTLAAPGEEEELRAAVLRYSREVGFAAAEVYAAAAEARGAWDARVEAGVVEALVRGAVGELTLSRATSLGWGRPAWTTALACPVPDDPRVGAAATRELRGLARTLGVGLLAGEVGGALLLVVGGDGDRAEAVGRLAAALPPGAVVEGPVASDLPGASACVQESLAALAAVPAWPDAPRPVPAEALLVERVLVGDAVARARLVEQVHDRLLAAGGDLLATVAAYVEGGGSVEGTGRALFLHPNTVRYRLRKVRDATGLDAASPRDALLLRLGVMLGRLPVDDRS